MVDAIGPSVGLTGAALASRRIAARLVGLLRLAAPDRVVHRAGELTPAERAQVADGPALAEAVLRGGRGRRPGRGHPACTQPL
ncbi:MAG: hypothetical protein R3F43_17205 [bacterium]